MAGSLNHITDDDGRFTMSLIENMGDAHEALEGCHGIIAQLMKSAGAPKTLLESACQTMGYPTPRHSETGHVVFPVALTGYQRNEARR